MSHEPLQRDRPDDQRDELARLWDLVALLLAGAFSFFVAARVAVHIRAPWMGGELAHHATFLTLFENSHITPYSLWYFGQTALLSGSRGRDALLDSGLLLLGMLWFAKGVILAGLLRVRGASAGRALGISCLLGTAVAVPLPGAGRSSDLSRSWLRYIGTLPPNTFMSATQIVAHLAAGIALVALGLWCRQPSSRSAATAVVTAAIATFAKPGIGPALLAAFVLCGLLLMRGGLESPRRLAVQLATATVAIGIPVAVGYFGFMDGGYLGGLHAVVRPFAVWSFYTDRIPLDILASLAFPLAVLLALLPGRGLRSETGRLLWPSWSATVAGIAMFAVLAEADGTGATVYSGNFAWGAMAAVSGLYVTSAMVLPTLTTKRRRLCLLVLVTQAVAGVLYLRHYLGTGSYL